MFLQCRAFVLAATMLSAPALTGCAPVDNLIAQDLPTACAAVSTTHVSFVTLAATGAISAKAIADEKTAYAGAAAICANPGDVTLATALPIVASAYAAIVAARSGR